MRVDLWSDLVCPLCYIGKRRFEKALASAPRRAATIVPVPPTIQQFDGRDLTAPIYATAWDSDVIVTLFADGRTEVKTRRQAR